MKTSIKTFACAFAIVVIAAFSALADNKDAKKSTGFGTGIYTTKDGKINVFVDKVNNEAATTILVRNQSGDVVYREKIDKKEQKFGRSLNVEQLAPGKYLIEITSNGQKQTKTFELQAPKIERVLAMN